MWQMCYHTVANVLCTSNKHNTTLTFIWSCVSGHLMNVSPILTLLKIRFSLQHLLRNISGYGAKCSAMFTS